MEFLLRWMVHISFFWGDWRRAPNIFCVLTKNIRVPQGGGPQKLRAATETFFPIVSALSVPSFQMFQYLEINRAKWDFQI